METVLFREKFIDWPEYERDDLEKEYRLNGGQRIRALNGAQLFAGDPFEEPNLILESANLGRGHFYYDTDTMRHYDILTQSVAKWQVDEANFSVVPEKSYAHFYSSDSYIVRWMYQISVTVRELTGQISKRNTVGRDRCVYFCWQGADASANEKGASALFTVELDKEKGSQVRLSQGEETTAFVRLFEIMFVHRGRQEEANGRDWRLFMLTGNLSSEIMASEVHCSIDSMRSRASMLLVNRKAGHLFVWHGCKSPEHSRDIARSVSKVIREKHFGELFVDGVEIRCEAVDEGAEPQTFFDAIGSEDRRQYFNLLESTVSCNFTPRLFQFTSTNGHMEAIEILSQFRYAPYLYIVNTPSFANIFVIIFYFQNQRID